MELKAEMGCTKRQQQQKEIKKEIKKERKIENRDCACTLCRLNAFAVRFAVDQKDHF